ncbi:MAG: N-acetylmuramoyl-L-alanine amidase, partial [Alphaproteobacteria bacterium]
RTRFTRAQWNALDRLVSDLGLRFPDATLHGHNEFNSAKTCPGFDVAQWITEPLRVEMAHLWEEA